MKRVLFSVRIIEQFEKASRDLVEPEKAELAILESYLLPDEEIATGESEDG